MSHNPGWTDEKRSDPGITLVQLFAFLAFAIAFAVTWRLVRESSVGVLRRSGRLGPWLRCRRHHRAPVRGPGLRWR